MHRVVLAFTCLVLAACRPDAPAGGAAGASGGFAAELGVDTAALTRMPSGLQYEDVAVGSGDEATAGRTAVVHYTGWLPDGKKFDSSRDRDEPFSFPLGAGQVIAGWDQGVAGMKVGGLAWPSGSSLTSRVENGHHHGRSSRTRR